MANHEKSGHRNRGKGGQRMKYEEYKDSGVEWIGEVPSHWEVRKIKSLSIVKRGASPRPIEDPKYFDDNGEYAWVRIADVSNSERYLEETTQTLSKLGASLSVKREPGDIFISIAGTVGKPIITHIKCCIHDGFVWFPYLKQNTEFLYYLFMSGQPYLGLGKMGTQLNLNTETIGNILIPLPPLPEQQAIATYLDGKYGEINRAIDVQKKKIELLNELKQTIITDAVTKGLNPNAPMKNSGVEWIGKVPEHWKVMRLRFACEFRNGYTPSKTNSDFWENGTIPWYRMEDIRESGRFLNEAKQYITEEAVKGNGLFEAGSFILATTATIGEHAMLIADSLANQRFTNLKIRKSLSNRLSRYFLFYYLFVIDDYCKSTTRTATFPAVNMDDLKNFGVTIPPLQEQQAIIAHIEQETGKIDFQIAKANSRIELLEELKQSIITEAVTGKIKVC